MKEWVRLEAIGFSGGIWVLWNRQEVSLEVVYTYKYFIHVVVKEGAGRLWHLSTIYASPNPRRKQGC